jgi:glycosyltransferase involved in cell wall biosynthesis
MPAKSGEWRISMVVTAPSEMLTTAPVVVEPGDLFGPDGVLTIPSLRHDEGGSLRIGMMGTRGLPARYGGFETAVEEIGKRLAQWGHRVTVYCRNLGSKRGEAVSEYMGMRLVTLPFLPVKQLETLSHTYMSVRHELKRKDTDDVVLIFNAANGYLLPMLRRAGIPAAVNTDGLEWMRGKWGRAGRRYYRMAEGACVRYADRLISDSRGIQEYYATRYGTRPEFIPYGAAILEDRSSHRLDELGLEPFGYHLVVARLEPENNVDMIVEGYRSSSSSYPLVIVGGNAYDPTIESGLRQIGNADPRVRPLGPVWDQELLDQLYMNSASYLHGHSVGGTNPSLLRAMGAGSRVIAFDSRFNREVLLELGSYFATSDHLADQLEKVESPGDDSPMMTFERAAATRDRIRTAYNWDSVAMAYLEVCRQLAPVPAGALVAPH